MILVQKLGPNIMLMPTRITYATCAQKPTSVHTLTPIRIKTTFAIMDVASLSKNAMAELQLAPKRQYVPLVVRSMAKLLVTIGTTQPVPLLRPVPYVAQPRARLLVTIGTTQLVPILRLAELVEQPRAVLYMLPLLT